MSDEKPYSHTVPLAYWTCGVCRERFYDEVLVRACHARHVEDWNKKEWNWKVGDQVSYEIREEGGSYCLHGTVVRIEGVLWDAKLLIEQADGARQWVGVAQWRGEQGFVNRQCIERSEAR